MASKPQRYTVVDKAHLETLRRIRRITADGVLDAEELRELTAYLLEDDDARAAWPGSLLWPTLESVYEDGVVTDEELAIMGDILVGILSECAAKPDLGLTAYIRAQSRRDRPD